MAQFGENVAYDFILRDDLVSGVMQRWMNSSTHRDNILGNFNVIGIGIWPAGDGKLYFTQLFARTREAAAPVPEPVSIPRVSPFPSKGR